MDENLDQRWGISNAPFDGKCIWLIDCVELPRLRSILRIIVDVLRERAKTSALFHHYDWHEHDGYVTQSMPTDWDAIDKILQDDEKLYSSRHCDAYVHGAYYPDDFSFLLRYYILDPDEDPELAGPHGECDLCADADTIEKIFSKGKLIADCFEVGSAKKYFDEIYAG